MRTTCPACGTVFDTAKAKAAPLEELNKLYKAFGLEETIAREYTDCFRVSREAANSTPKEKRLLGELIAMWQGEVFGYKGRDWRTTRERIRDAMLVCCNRQLIGLKNHNYLKAILHKQAENDEIRTERDKHEAALKRNRPRSQGFSSAAGVITRSDATRQSPPTPEDIEEIRKIIADGKRMLKIKPKGGDTQ
jgi:hypothetical protein